MHHLALERWSLRDSPVHRLDARVKTLAALGVLLSLALTSPERWSAYLGYFVLITTAALAARLPLGPLLLRSLVVLPFVAGVVILNFWGGDPARAWQVLTRSCLSAYCVLLLLATTPFPRLLRGLELLGVPSFFLMVLHFVYRYLFLLVDQAQNMHRSRQCRAPRGRRQPLFQAAAGAVAVLFARSYDRAERIHRAMLARGFQGHFVALAPARIGWREWSFSGLCLVALVGLQLAAHWWNLP